MNIDNLALRPNCLLTKYPLVFITGKRSLFFYEKLGGNLQDFITAHGYVVLSPVLPFRSKQLRKKYLKQWLMQQKQPQFHFILNELTYLEFQQIFKNYKNSTFTLTTKKFTSSLAGSADKKSKEPFSYQLHRYFCAALGVQADQYSETLQDKSTEFYDRFLDHCVELAENEY